MHKQKSEWGSFYNDTEDWEEYKGASKTDGRYDKLKRFLKQTIAAGLLFGCFYGMHCSGTEIGRYFSRAAEYSVNSSLNLAALREQAEPYLSRFAEVEIFQGVQTAAARVIRPLSLVEKPANWVAGDFDGERRLYNMKKNTDIQSIGNGRVIAVNDLPESKQVVIQYGYNLEADYSNLAAVYVQKGERLRTGQAVGRGNFNQQSNNNEFTLQLLNNGRVVDSEEMFNIE